MGGDQINTLSHPQPYVFVPIFSSTVVISHTHTHSPSFVVIVRDMQRETVLGSMLIAILCLAQVQSIQLQNCSYFLQSTEYKY